MGDDDDPFPKNDALSTMITAEALRRVYDRATYTTPFPPMTAVRMVSLALANNNTDDDDDPATEISAEEIELEQFLDGGFCVRDKTEEIVAIMRTTPALQTLFEELVPTVISYVDFWTRFYFRCDPDRIRRLNSVVSYRCSATTTLTSDNGNEPMPTWREQQPPDTERLPVSCQQTESSFPPTIRSPTSVSDQNFEFDDHSLRKLSLEGL
jgi:BSD domain